VFCDRLGRVANKLEFATEAFSFLRTEKPQPSRGGTARVVHSREDGIGPFRQRTDPISNGFRQIFDVIHERSSDDTDRHGTSVDMTVRRRVR
jgi:hypothetical protein